MDEDGEEDRTPFWVQSSANLRRTDRLRRGVAAVFLSSGLVVFLLLVTAVFFLVYVVPSTISFSATIFRPNSVKKSWDSLNVVLVLVAVVFGFLSRNRNQDRFYQDEFEGSPTKDGESRKLNSEKWYGDSRNEEKPNRWYEHSDYQDEFQASPIKDGDSRKLNPEKWYGDSRNEGKPNRWYEHSDYQEKDLILRRNVSSYPDLREVSSDWGFGDYQRRFSDDFYVDSGRVPDPDELRRHRRYRSMEQVDYLREIPQSKSVIVDTLVRKSNESTNAPSPPPTAADAVAMPATAVEIEEIAAEVNGNAGSRKEKSRRKSSREFESSDPVTAPPPPEAESPPQEIRDIPRRNYERVARRKERKTRKQDRDMGEGNHVAAPPSPPPPPPKQKSDKRSGGATGSATKDFLNSLYQKKRKQRQRSVDNMDSLLHESQPPVTFQIPPPSPPPPPPPPPPSVFQNLFSSKKHKRKRTITVTLEPHSPPPPPPPPPPPRAAAIAAARAPHPTPATTRKPPKPIKMNSFGKLEDQASNSGGESPLNRIPPPPPPPPPSFKGLAWKFVVQGDYVRVNSNNSSRSGSPELDEEDSDVTPSAADGGAAAFHPSPLFCASPDVNTKAESFISNFRAKLKLEKIHSMGKREIGPSSLGPGSGPNQS